MVASLRTPPTHNRRLHFPSRVRARVRMVLPASTAARYVPSVPQSIPRCRDHTRLPPNPHRIDSRQAKDRNRLSDSSVAMQGGNSRSIRQVIPTASGAFLGGCSDQGQPLCCSPTVDPPQDVLQVPRVLLATVSVLLCRVACDSCQLADDIVVDPYERPEPLPEDPVCYQADCHRVSALTPCRHRSLVGSAGLVSTVLSVRFAELTPSDSLVDIEPLSLAPSPS